MAISNASRPLTDAALVWLDLLEEVMDHGLVSTARKTVFHEIIGKQCVIDMQRPVIDIPERKLGHKFLAAEAAWILSGDNRVSSLGPFAKQISQFSDDGITFAGAYGPMYRQQLPYIVKALREDRFTRQAVLTIWRPSPFPSRDIPCTISTQFMLRGNLLHCMLNMRSSDIWLGVPYDWFNFSMMAAHVLLHMRAVDPDNWMAVEPGALIYTAGSCHLYTGDLAKAIAIRKSSSAWDVPYKPFNINEFRNPNQLVDHLWNLAKRWGNLGHDWLKEIDKWTHA